MDLCNQSHLSSQLAEQSAVLCGENLNIGQYLQIFQSHFLLPEASLTSTITYGTTFIDLDMAGGWEWGAQGQLKAKRVSFSFWHFFFQLIRMKF